MRKVATPKPEKNRDTHIYIYIYISVPKVQDTGAAVCSLRPGAIRAPQSEKGLPVGPPPGQFFARPGESYRLPLAGESNLLPRGWRLPRYIDPRRLMSTRCPRTKKICPCHIFGGDLQRRKPEMSAPNLSLNTGTWPSPQEWAALRPTKK